MQQVIKLATEIIQTMERSEAEDFEKRLALRLVPLMSEWRGTKNFLNERQGLTEKVTDFGFPLAEKSAAD